jgi:hypothetical protein
MTSRERGTAFQARFLLYLIVLFEFEGVRVIVGQHEEEVRHSEDRIELDRVGHEGGDQQQGHSTDENQAFPIEIRGRIEGVPEEKTRRTERKVKNERTREKKQRKMD